ncbi:hypothetical protein M409DRAFT_61554 [Zasmidium cellare ATCC 36951]|uniref:Uncharacterized protein n=1 Tax=Zasmidium cellare ATCC 36951 TaxID=1080233 RepID=A0A6A6BYA7_ZASCE|nr:uncharacterized protein M409DRAFT_61554 [Zasmidium cellare ATCC 36951]KAF2158542.1 hypothetical protein M409DRAFT_61554 [Zasmidium cellare ATCC 36951]
MFRVQNSFAGDGENTMEPSANFAAARNRFSYENDRQRVSQELSVVQSRKARRAMARLRSTSRTSDDWDYDIPFPNLGSRKDSSDSQALLEATRSPIIIEEETEWEEDPIDCRGAFLLVACISCPRMVFIQYKSDKLVEIHSGIDITNQLIMISCRRCEMDPETKGPRSGTLQECWKGYTTSIHVNHFSSSPLLSAARVAAGQDVPFAQVNDRVLFVSKDAIRDLGTGQGRMRGLDLAKVGTNDACQVVMSFAPVDFL